MHLARSYREEFHRAGYDLEEEYFARINRELIQHIREERAAGRVQPLAYLRSLPSPPPAKLDKWLGLIFKPLPTGIYSFPV